MAIKNLDIQKGKRIGIALSGGGTRAMAFHLGTLKFLAENHLFSRITYVSSVSGGTLITGLIYKLNNYKWPTDEQFLALLPVLQDVLINKPLMSKYYIKTFVTHPFLFISNRRVLMSELMQDIWGINVKFGELTGNVNWDICATTLETGNRWRIRKDNMGDHSIGYAKIDMALSDLMSISACFPPVVNQYTVKLSDKTWENNEYGTQKRYNLSEVNIVDGGVYDNLGVESLYDISEGQIKQKADVDILIVSDASKPLAVKEIKFSILRLFDVTMENINKLRMRSLVQFFLKTKQGMYVKLGESYKDILDSYKKVPDIKIPESVISGCNTSKDDLEKIRNYDTDLYAISQGDLELMMRHSYENCYLNYNVLKDDS